MDKVILKDLLPFIKDQFVKIFYLVDPISVSYKPVLLTNDIDSFTEWEKYRIVYIGVISNVLTIYLD